MREPHPELLPRLLRANAARRAGTFDAAFERELHRATGCDQRLAVYGSLAPGEANHREVEGLGGTWTPATVRGHRAIRTWPVFTWDEAAPEVAVQVLASARLPTAWPRLDAFEGAAYCRILVLVRFANGPSTVANLYSAVDPVGGDDASARNRSSTR